jgi:two-component system, chemotaxis family, sensor kinase CheA
MGKPTSTTYWPASAYETNDDSAQQLPEIRAMQLDDEILHDFLIEAQEIIENLDSQLVELEGSPEDAGLLNAVFRGFHTIKGGAGFLALDALVEIAHKAEDVFDLLRNGKCRMSPAIMDVFLRVLDSLRAMFDELRAGAAPTRAAPELMAALIDIAKGTTAAPAPAAVVSPENAPGTDDFDSVVAMMLEADAPAMATEAADAPVDLITDDEFEALLDSKAAKPTSAFVVPTAGGDGIITDDEFEAVLDKLHGGGKFNVAKKVAPPVAPASKPVAKTEPPAAAGARKTEAQEGDNTIRVGTEVLDRIMNMVGELVLIRNRLDNLQETIGNPEMTQAVANLNVVTSDLQMTAMKTRMQPIKKVFGRFPRVVRDLARSLNKEIELELVGEDTDLDKNLVEALSDPLVHLVRNSCDHGVELPAEREAAGKPRAGRLRLTAAQIGDQIVLTIEDDGKGMNAEVLRAKSVEKGLLDEDAAARLSERECFELIFLPGFSTKDQISDVSGRGVGMDVVKTRIAQLNGAIEIDSKIGTGTTIQIRVPLTLAIMPTLMVMLGNQVFALPLVSVKEIIDFKREYAQDISGKKTLVVRERAIPLFYMSRWLVSGVNDYLVDKGHVVVVGVGNQTVGLLVDDLIGQEEVVVKPLGIMLHGTKGLSGATITGNGRIALILDLPELIDVYGRR